MLGRPTAIAFSCSLAIPTLGGATLDALLRNLGTPLEDDSLALLAVGVATAFLTARVAIRWLLGYVAHHDFRYFALYRVVVGVVILLILRPQSTASSPTSTPPAPRSHTPSAGTAPTDAVAPSYR